MSFLTELKGKLTYAYGPELIELDSFTTTEITTANTVSTLATHSANTLKSADLIKIGYRAAVDNQSVGGEDFTFTLDLGSDSFAQTVTVAAGDADIIGITATLTRINSTTFLAEINFIHTAETTGTITQFPVITTVTDTRVTECTITAENETTVASGCDLIGNGGFLLIDSF